MVELFHLTCSETAHAILGEGFRDSTITYAFDVPQTGVWLSDISLV